MREYEQAGHWPSSVTFNHSLAMWITGPFGAGAAISNQAKTGKSSRFARDVASTPRIGAKISRL
jgi:hypothetical protein